jgi:hypothetical protein
MYKLSGAIVKLASINLRKLVLSPTGSINLGFILREDLLMCSLYLPLGFPTGRTSTRHQQTLVTYFKLKPLDLNLVHDVTQSFATFRTYKDRIPVVLRVPSASIMIFLRIMDTVIY